MYRNFIPGGWFLGEAEELAASQLTRMEPDFM
jgi:hypothetical protein